MIRVSKPPSGNATGIPKQVTPMYIIKGVRQRANISKIIIDVENDEIEVQWNKEYLDEDNNVLNVLSEIHSEFVRDEPEYGEEELDTTTGLGKIGTYVKISDENLDVTQWYSKLGRTIFVPALLMIKKAAGYNNLK